MWSCWWIWIIELSKLRWTKTRNPWNVIVIFSQNEWKIRDRSNSFSCWVYSLMSDKIIADDCVCCFHTLSNDCITRTAYAIAVIQSHSSYVLQIRAPSIITRILEISEFQIKWNSEKFNLVLFLPRWNRLFRKKIRWIMTFRHRYIRGYSWKSFSSHYTEPGGMKTFRQDTKLCSSTYDSNLLRRFLYLTGTIRLLYK